MQCVRSYQRLASRCLIPTRFMNVRKRESMQYVRRLMSTGIIESQSNNDIFPSLIIGASGKIEPQGSFAEAQAEVSDIYE